MTAIASQVDRKLMPVEEMLSDLSKSEAQIKPAKIEQEEIIEYLMDTLRLAKKKTRSKKLPDLTKIRWTRAGIEASKVLLYSGALNKQTTREIRSIQEIFASFYQDNEPSKAPSGKNNDFDDLT